MECFGKIVNGWKPLTILTKHSILDVWQDFENTSRFTSFCQRLSDFPQQLFSSFHEFLNSTVNDTSCLQNCVYQSLSSATGTRALTFQTPILQNGHAHSNNLSAFVDEFPVDAGRKLNVHKTFNLSPVSTELFECDETSVFLVGIAG